MRKPTFGVPLEKLAKQVGLPISTIHRIFTIRQFGWEHYKHLLFLESNDPEAEVYPNYKKIKSQLKQYHFSVSELALKKGGLEKVSIDEIKEIVSKYDLLTYPFEMRDRIK